MRAKAGLLCVSALGALGAAAVVFGWRWVERESAVGVVGSAPYDDSATAQRIGSADSGGSMLPDAALAAAPDCLAASFEPAASQPQRIARQFLGELGIADVRTLPGLLITDLAGVDPFGDKGVDRFTRELRGLDIPRLDLLLPPVVGDQGEREILGFSRQRPLEDALQEPTLDQFIAAAHNEPTLTPHDVDEHGAGIAGEEPALPTRHSRPLAHNLSQTPRQLHAWHRRSARTTVGSALDAGARAPIRRHGRAGDALQGEL